MIIDLEGPPVAAKTTKSALKTAASTATKEDAKAAALAAFLKESDKDNPGDVVLLNDDRARVNIRTVSTGAISLDLAINGGIPFGRISEIFGPEGGGKTTLALTAAKNCQDEGGIIGFVDAEHGLNRELCRNLGIDESRFVVVQPDFGEDAMMHIERMLDSGAFDMIIVDSVAAMVPKAEIDAEAEQQHMGLHARLMSKLCRRITGRVSEKGVAMVLLNQTRTQLGAYGAPETSTGGKAIKFYASLRLEVRSNIGGKKIERNKKIVGQEVTVTVRKNRLGAPGKVATYDVIFGQGIEGSGSILEVAEELGLVTRAGASYTEVATGERIGIGKDTVKGIIKDDGDLRERIEAAIYAHLNGSIEIEHDDDADLAAAVAAEAAAFGDD